MRAFEEGLITGEESKDIATILAILDDHIG